MNCQRPPSFCGSYGTPMPPPPMCPIQQQTYGCGFGSGGLATQAVAPVMAATPGIAAKQVYAHQEVKKNCGFPWWILLLLLALVVILLVWAWIRSTSARPTAVVVADGSRGYLDYPPGHPAAAYNGAAVGYPGNQSGPWYDRWVNGNGSASPYARGGATGPWYTSGAAAGNGAIRNGTGRDVSAMAQQGKECLVMYTMKGCGHCVKTYPELADAARKINVPTIVADMDTLPANDRPNGYPYIFYQKSDGTRVRYNGQRTSDAFVSFARSNCGAAAGWN